MFAKIIGTLLTVLLVLAALALFWITDANRLKPELTELINSQSEYTIDLNGDLRWQLFPPLTLSAEEVVARQDEEEIRLARLEAKLDLSAMWRSVDAWVLRELDIYDTILEEPGSRVEVSHLSLDDFAIGAASPFALDLQYTDTDTESPTPMPASVAGTLTFSPQTDSTPPRYALDVTRLTTPQADGHCDVSAVETGWADEVPETRGDLLPLDTLLAYNFDAHCILTRLEYGGETFTDADLALTNSTGKLGVEMQIRDFLGGTLDTVADIDVSPKRVDWTVLPQITGVDSQRLMTWSRQNLNWVAPLAANSTITMRGNTAEELTRSLRAQSTFDGGQGQLDIRKLKAQLSQIAALARQTDEVQNWPEVWDYASFTGDWSINGQQQALRFTLDNLSVQADGEYDYPTDALDMLAYVTITEPAEGSPYRINPILEDTPIPVRCRGSAADPKCRLDSQATQNLIGRALTRGDDTGLRRKIEEKIDEEVPEQYREVARDILDLLGRSLEKD
ncbi:MAG: AsmA family protein [Pseudomonadota bacterium]